MHLNQILILIPERYIQRVLLKAAREFINLFPRPEKDYI